MTHGTITASICEVDCQATPNRFLTLSYSSYTHTHRQTNKQTDSVIEIIKIDSVHVYKRTTKYVAGITATARSSSPGLEDINDPFA